jgi:hypothetical protein
MLYEAIPFGEKPTRPLADMAKDIVADHRARKQIVPGLGHPLHKPIDPRTPRLFQIAAENGLSTHYVALMQAVQGEAERVSGKSLPINATGAIGAIAAEFGFPWKIIRGIGVMARAIGWWATSWRRSTTRWPSRSGSAWKRKPAAPATTEKKAARPMNNANDKRFPDIRDAVRDLCAQFPNEYFRKIDEARGYPAEFVEALTKAGWMAALIPQEYGGSGLGLTEASVIMEEINRCGGNSGACHGQMYNMGTLLRHGSEAQKRELYLPRIATGELRLQSMGVTEPSTGTDTTKIKTTAVKKGDRYVINGQKVWISRIQHSDLMILLARTTPLADVKKKSEGHVDLHRRPARGGMRA